MAADVEVTANSGGINLDTQAGTTAHVASSVTVDGGTFADGFTASAHAWTITNDGTVKGSNAIEMSAGGTVYNNAGATVTGNNSAINLGDFITYSGTGPGTVVNAGTISNGTFGDTVALYGGGSVTNLQGATISGNNSTNTVSISGGTSRTVTNSGTITNTGSSYATGVYVAGGASTVTNTATGTIFGGYNGVYASGSANLTLDNAGSITSTRGPAVEIDGGGGTVTNSGTIQSAAGSGRAALRLAGAGSVTNSGTIRSTGSGIAIAFSGSASHTLTLQTGSVIDGNVQGGSGTDNLVLKGTGTESIAKFSSFETLSMQGTDWTLNGYGTFSAMTTVQAGTLRVAGQLTSPAIAVQNGATLTGTGTVVGNVTNMTGGNVQVDNATLLTFNGNYIHQAGAYFTVGLTPSTNGALAITGTGHTATLNGGTVRVLAGLGSYAPNTTYTILTASGGRTGTFDSATTNLAFLAPSLTYDASNVYLTLTRNTVDFSGIGLTPNQISAGRGVEQLGLSNPIVNAVLVLTPEQARAAFDSVSGEIHPSLRALMLDESYVVRDALLGRQMQGASGFGAPRATAFADDGEASAYAARTRRTAAANAPKWPIKTAPVPSMVYGAWVQAYGNWTQINGDGNAATLRAATGGAIGGVDVTFDGNWRFGLAIGGGRSDARVDARLSSGTIDTVHIAGYGGGMIGDIALRTGAAYSHHDVSTTRAIAFPGFADFATARYGAGTTQVFGEAAYRMVRSWLTAEAFADLAHVRVHSDNFTEAGGPAALTVAAADTESTFTTLGMRAEVPLPPSGSWQLAARGSLAWQHAFDATAPVSLMAFAASPAPFAIAGVPLAADMLLVTAGLDALVTRDVRLSLHYSGRLADNASAHAVKAGFAMQF